MAVQNKSNVPVGTVLEGKFRITREIGRGGMAAVYEAENIDIGKRVAVKVLAAELITSRVVRERFIREARAASAVRSPHICDVYDSGMYEERPFLVMELLEGESLYDMLTRLRRLDIPTVLAVTTQTSRGLGKAHEANIVHRDLKPENIFVSKDEDGGLIVKLLDFGLAKFYEPTNDGDPKTVRLTREGALFGTPAYMSPEQAKGQGEVDHRSDLWALGCIVYECLTGQTVWSVEQGVAMILAQVASAPLPRPTRIRTDLPPTFDGWFQKALDRDTAKRFQTARELADTLQDALVPPEEDGLPGSAGRQPSLHTETEAGHLDELMASSSHAVVSESNRPPPDLMGPDSADGVTPGPVVSEDTRSSGLPALFLAAALVLGGYAVWLTVLHPAGERDRNPTLRASRPVPSASAARVEPKVRVQRDPDTEPFAQLMREGQALFDKKPAEALEKLKAAYALGSASPARSLLSHASVAVEEATKGGCKVAAIARPRPYPIEQQASAPALLRTSEGVLLAWVDMHADARRRQAHVVLLDEALRRNGDPLAITPEATNVQGLELYPVGDKVLLLFYDDGGKQPGLYSRQLDLDGRITSPAVRVSRARPLDHRVVLASASDGSRYAVWVEQLDAGITDVMAAKLAPSLDALDEPRRLTTFPPIKGLAERAQGVGATIVRGELQVVFAVEQPGVRSEVMLLTTPLSLLAAPKATEATKGKRPASPPFVGTIRSVTKVVVGRVPEPRIACESEGCLVTWDEEKGGAFIAFLEHGRTQPLWHRQFAEKGARPVLGGDAQGLALSWFEESRLRLAPVGRDGVGKPSLINRVNGLQPHAELARGTKPGEWLVAWRDYEAGHLELFALRAECP